MKNETSSSKLCVVSRQHIFESLMQTQTQIDGAVEAEFSTFAHTLTAQLRKLKRFHSDEIMGIYCNSSTSIVLNAKVYLRAKLIGLEGEKRAEQNSNTQQVERVLVNGKFSHIFFRVSPALMLLSRIHDIQQH